MKISTQQPMRPAEIELVEQVNNQQVSIRLYNNTSTNADSVSIDWLAISGR